MDAEIKDIETKTLAKAETMSRPELMKQWAKAKAATVYGQRNKFVVQFAHDGCVAAGTVGASFLRGRYGDADGDFDVPGVEGVPLAATVGVAAVTASVLLADPKASGVSDYTALLGSVGVGLMAEYLAHEAFKMGAKQQAAAGQSTTPATTTAGYVRPQIISGMRRNVYPTPRPLVHSR